MRPSAPTPRCRSQRCTIWSRLRLMLCALLSMSTKSLPAPFILVNSKTTRGTYRGRGEVTSGEWSVERGAWERQSVRASERQSVMEDVSDQLSRSNAPTLQRSDAPTLHVHF